MNSYQTLLLVLFSLSVSILLISLHALHSRGELHWSWPSAEKSPAADGRKTPPVRIAANGGPSHLRAIDASGPPIRWSDLWKSSRAEGAKSRASSITSQPFSHLFSQWLSWKSVSGGPSTAPSPPDTKAASRGPPIRWSDLFHSPDSPVPDARIARTSSPSPSMAILQPSKDSHPANPSEHNAGNSNSNDPTQDTAATCPSSFPPTCSMYFYLQFWNQRFSSEDCHVSPLRPSYLSAFSPSASPSTLPWKDMKFVVFQPDQGGWNNIRMAAETVILFALASGRTLVLPPVAVWYLLTLGKNEENKSTFLRFFDLHKLSHALTIVTMEDFLQHVASPGLLREPYNASVLENYPGPQARKLPLWNYMEAACYSERWEPGKQFIGFNLQRLPDGTPSFNNTFTPSSPRYREMVAHGRKLRPYDSALHQERCIFFPGDYRNEKRLLTHFYTYLYWEEAHQANIYRRIVRDRMHYQDHIFCAAGRILQLIHQEAAALMGHVMPREQHPMTGGGNVFAANEATYHAAHIRRGDFQYHDMKLPAEDIWANIRPLFNNSRSRLLYIATDEKTKTFFAPFQESGEWVVRYLDDYLVQLPDLFASPSTEASASGQKRVTRNHIGMIEQIICANAHTFVGTPLSTFTGYITRMRGYYRDGRYRNTFYTVKKRMYQLQQQRSLVGPFWAREFELSHRDIDDFV